jgi:hypothetical protein
MVERDGRFRYLAAKCLAECEEWEECLATLGDGEGEEDVSLSELQVCIIKSMDGCMGGWRGCMSFLQFERLARGL